MADPLDDLLADGAPMTKGADDGDGFDDELDEPTDGDEFSMHAQDFLDDTLPMPDRIEALRNAILAAGGSPLGEEEF